LTPLERVGTVTGSMVLDQLYCEFLLDTRLREGAYRRISPGEARRIARLMVEAVASSGGWRASRITAVGEAAGVYWAISPDAALVVDGRVRALLRARLRRALRVYDSDFALLQLAALILDKQGLLHDNATLAVAVAASPEGLARALREALQPPGPRPLARGEWRIVTRIYDRPEAERLAAALAGYWLGSRPPRPRPGARCAWCPLSGRCPYARV
jgi:hypothetical protein